MLPTKSNTADKGCSPVSSNCVVWQGPDLSCINLCKGDSISDVTYKVATQLCTIKDELDLTDLDLSCLLNFCAAVNPAPTEKTLSAVLEFIIDKICCLNSIVENIDLSSTYVEPTLTLPTCLQYTDQTTNQLITVLQHNQYTLRLANQFCTLKTTVDSHTTQISSLSSRVTALENEPEPTLPLVTPTCLLVPGQSTEITALVDALENEFCNMKAALGSSSNITTAVAQQCTNLGTASALGTAGTMSQISGWQPVAGSLAYSFQNLWITVCDLRSAVAQIQQALELNDCANFALDFTLSAASARTIVNIDFNPGTLLPTDFGNCSGNGTIIKITDGVKTVTFNSVDLKSYANSATEFFPATVNGSGIANSLNTSSNYTVTVEACITKDGKTCQRTLTKTLYVECPVVTNVTATLV
jgi:hypothetical protein